MAFFPPRILPLTDRPISGVAHEEQIRALLGSGLRWVQVREKESADRALLADLDQAVEIGRRHGALIVVNDRPDLALLSGAGGVHLGEQDLPLADARQILGPAVVLGRSSHDEASAREAQSAGADYVALGPIFATRTKPDAGGAVGLAALRAVRRAVRIPVVAIGGITLDTAPAVLAAGADSVAVIRDLMGAPDLASRARCWQETLNVTGSRPRGLVFLTGFMGCGKTTLGRILAARLGRRFVDLDAEVEKRESAKVDEIFATRGEAAFRAAESMLLRSIPKGADAVVALGGGTLLDPAHRKLVGALGALVWLDCPLQESLMRCAAGPRRPLLEDTDRVARRRAERLPGYRGADLMLSSADRLPEDLAQQVMTWLDCRPRQGGEGALS